MANPTQIDLSWSASTDNVGVTSYRVYRAGNLIATLGNALQYASSGLAPATAHSHAVQACDAAGNCSALSAAVEANTPVAPPSLNLGVSAAVIDVASAVGTNDPARGGVAYAGAPIAFGPYTVSGLAAPTTVASAGPLAAFTQLVVNTAAGAASATVASGNTLLVRVDFAAFAAAQLAATGRALPYSTQYLPQIAAGPATTTFGGPGSGGTPVGGIITCGDPLVPPSPGSTPCR